MSNVLTLRLLPAVSIPIPMVVMGIYARGGNLSPAEAQALVLFQVSLFSPPCQTASAPSSWPTKRWNTRRRQQRDRYRQSRWAHCAALFSLGFVGLAAVSLIMNIIQAGLALDRHAPHDPGAA